MSAHRFREKVLAVSLALLVGPCLARDVTDSDLAEIRKAVRGLVRDDRILKVDAFWGEDNGSAVLEATVTARPFEVGDGLCATESYRVSRKEGESDFERINDDAPISSYWLQEGSCDVIDPSLVGLFGGVRGAVTAGQVIATVHVAQILRGADDILRLTTPEVRCNERVMLEMFQPGVRLRLAGIGVDTRHVPGSGVQYMASYVREGLRNNEGVWVRFTMQPGGFKVTSACHWLA